MSKNRKAEASNRHQAPTAIHGSEQFACSKPRLFLGQHDVGHNSLAKQLKVQAAKPKTALDDDEWDFFLECHYIVPEGF